MNTYPSSAFPTQKWVNITTEGQRHLGAGIASQEYKDQYCKEKVRAWKEEIERLSEIATSQPMRRILLSQKATSRSLTTSCAQLTRLKFMSIQSRK